MIPCAWKSLLGIDCFLCGFQRSFLYLLEGNILGSLKMYPPLLPLLFLFLVAISHLIFKFKYGASVVVKSFIFAVAVMLVNYGYKIYTGDLH